MKPEDFVELVRRMREAQKKYYSNRHIDALKLSKTLESQVDAAIRIMHGFDL